MFVGPRSLASRRHLLLQVVAATARVWWTAGKGRSTCLSSSTVGRKTSTQRRLLVRSFWEARSRGSFFVSISPCLGNSTWSKSSGRIADSKKMPVSVISFDLSAHQVARSEIVPASGISSEPSAHQIARKLRGAGLLPHFHAELPSNLSVPRSHAGSA